MYDDGLTLGDLLNTKDDRDLDRLVTATVAQVKAKNEKVSA